MTKCYLKFCGSFGNDWPTNAAIPPYIIFSDVSLRQMARDYPQNNWEFARISGVGEKKLREFGSLFMDEVGVFLQTNPRQIFADDSFPNRHQCDPG